MLVKVLNLALAQAPGLEYATETQGQPCCFFFNFQAKQYERDLCWQIISNLKITDAYITVNVSVYCPGR